MATFSENQVRHLYVATASGAVSEKSAAGTIKVKADKAKENFWFEYQSAGGRVSSDKIVKANMVNISARKSEVMERPLNRFEVKLDSAIQGVLGAEIAAGQDYILRLAFRHYVGMSDEDQYWKYGMVHGTLGMTSDTFYKTLVNSLLINAMRDDNKLFKVFVVSASKGGSNVNSTTLTAFVSGVMEVTKPIKNFADEDDNNPYYVSSSTLVNDITSIIIEEVEQPWVLGKIAIDKMPIEIQPATIQVAGDEVLWGTVKKQAPKTFIKNGKEIADLEYFCMGERADIYRNIGWPNTIETKYLVNPEKNYDVIDITYFYAGDNEDIQKSQKTITIVADDSSNTIINAIIADLSSAAGVTVTLKGKE